MAGLFPYRFEYTLPTLSCLKSVSPLTGNVVILTRVQEVWEKDSSLSAADSPPLPHLSLPKRDIEIVNLERVGFNLKNFDMAIVFKDFSRDVMRIDSVPTKSLETIKDWLTSVKIKYYESKLNLAWKPILKSIVEDPDGFIDQGGWEFLNMDVSCARKGDGLPGFPLPVLPADLFERSRKPVLGCLPWH